jgi:hypothetical protein
VLLAEQAAVLIPIGQQLVILSLVVVSGQQQTVLILLWVITQVRLITAVLEFVSAGVTAQRLQALHLLADKSLHN